MILEDGKIIDFNKAGRRAGFVTKNHPVQGSIGGAGLVAFDYPATLIGSTTNFDVYCDPELDIHGGANAANAVLATCEQDYVTLCTWFGCSIPSSHLPFNIILAPLGLNGMGSGSAYHHPPCDTTTLYCDVKYSPTLDLDYTRLLVFAEVVEVFEAASGRWVCSQSDGEGLSRVLAEEMYPLGVVPDIYTAKDWLDYTRNDYLTHPGTDQDHKPIGCAVLILYYLKYQLGYTWPQIIQAAGNTLVDKYTTLTGKTDAFNGFCQLLETRYPTGTPSCLTTDNPFPLPVLTPPPPPPPCPMSIQF